MPVIVRDCPHCPATSSSFTLGWEYKLDSFWVVAAICGACRLPITCQLLEDGGWGRQPSNVKGNVEDDWTIMQVWPDRTALSAPAHTPSAVAKRYIEGEAAYGRGSWNAAVAMYRSALDIATKGLPDVPQGQTFFKRLEWLHKNHRITPDMRAWADHVRVEGNDALHDPEEFTEADARPLRLFTETFIRYVFELPGEVKVFRGETPEA